MSHGINLERGNGIYNLYLVHLHIIMTAIQASVTLKELLQAPLLFRVSRKFIGSFS